MNAELFARYVARLRNEAAEHYDLNVEVPYMVGRKRQAAGWHWSNATRLTYRAQRLARLGYVDGARGRPVRPIAENWTCLNCKLGASPTPCIQAD